MHYIEPNLREEADFLFVELDDGDQRGKEKSWHDSREVGGNLPILRVEKPAEVEGAVLWIDVLFDEVLNYERLLAFLLEFAELSTDFEQTHNFADVISFIVVVSVFFRNDERHCFFDALNTDSEVQEGHIQVEKLLKTLIHSIVQVERVDQRKNFGWPPLPVHPVHLPWGLCYSSYLGLLLLL